MTYHLAEFIVILYLIIDQFVIIICNSYEERKSMSGKKYDIWLQFF